MSPRKVVCSFCTPDHHFISRLQYCAVQYLYCYAVVIQSGEAADEPDPFFVLPRFPPHKICQQFLRERIVGPVRASEVASADFHTQ